MSTHALFTAPNSDGIWYSLRSDATVWKYNVTTGWTQDTSGQTNTLWQAAAQGYAAAVAMAGFAVAEGESGGSAPPPPPQV